MKKLSFLLIALLLSVLTFAQPGKVDVETINGKKYYAHFVQKGQTLYAIHQMYNVPVGDIVRANNGLNDGLQIGQKVLVPIPLDDKSYYGEHIIKKGETLYGISKQYKCTVDDLKALNPELNETAISIGQKLKVPLETNTKPNYDETMSEEKIITDPVSNQTGSSLTARDSIIEHTVLPHETLYSISKRYMVSMQSIKELNNLKSSSVKEGDVLKIKVKKVNYEIIENPLEENIEVIDTSLALPPIKKDKYKVALFLPLMLSANQSYMNKPLRPGQHPELHPTTKIAADFYHGFILAADSLTKAGLNVEVYVYDTKKDTNQIAKQLAKKEFENMDLIVGPLFPKTITYVANYCKNNHVKMVVPFKSPTKVLYQNPYVYKSTASNITLMDGMVDYIVENHAHHHVSIFKPKSSSDLALYEEARERYNTKMANQQGVMTPKIQELILGSSGGRDLVSKLRKDTVNVIIVPSTNLKYVAGVFVALNGVLNINTYAKSMKIIVFGLEDWNKYKDIDLKHRMRMHQHYASYRYIDYKAEKTKKMMLSFRNKYATDPDVYGVQGFDVGYYFLSALYLKGVNFDSTIDEYRVETVQNDFYFPTDSTGSGRENHTVFIVEYNDYELVLKDKRIVEK